MLLYIRRYNITITIFAAVINKETELEPIINLQIIIFFNLLLL